MRTTTVPLLLLISALGIMSLMACQASEPPWQEEAAQAYQDTPTTRGLPGGAIAGGTSRSSKPTAFALHQAE